jgi:hypothetical protein
MMGGPTCLFLIHLFVTFESRKSIKNLLELALEAHGGLTCWSQLKAVNCWSLGNQCSTIPDKLALN